MLTTLRSGSGRQAVLWFGVPLLGVAAAAALFTMSASAATGGFGLNLAGASSPNCSALTPSMLVTHCRMVSLPASRPQVRVPASVPQVRPVQPMVLPAPYAVSPMSPGEAARISQLKANWTSPAQP